MLGFIIVGGTVFILVSLIGWVVWLNWYDMHTERTIGRQFDHFAGKEEPEKRKRFRDEEEESDRD